MPSPSFKVLPLPPSTFFLSIKVFAKFPANRLEDLSSEEIQGNGVMCGKFGALEELEVGNPVSSLSSGSKAPMKDEPLLGKGLEELSCELDMEDLPSFFFPSDCCSVK